MQYGTGVKTGASSFPKPHHLPVERTAQIFDDLVHQPVGAATVLMALEE